MTSCFCPIGSLDLLITCFIRWSFFTLLYFAIFDLQYIVFSSMYLLLDMCIWFHSYYEKCIPWEELVLYWPSKFGTHFVTCWQWGRSLDGLREMVLYLSLVWA
jgi:hypothetical protein